MESPLHSPLLHIFGWFSAQSPRWVPFAAWYRSLPCREPRHARPPQNRPPSPLTKLRSPTSDIAQCGEALAAGAGVAAGFGLGGGVGWRGIGVPIKIGVFSGIGCPFVFSAMSRFLRLVASPFVG